MPIGTHVEKESLYRLKAHVHPVGSSFVQHGTAYLWRTYSDLPRRHPDAAWLFDPSEAAEPEEFSLLLLDEIGE